jgi:hypothetical protein
MDPIRTQRIESIFLLAGALWVYTTLHASWWFFGILILAPDLSMLGYLKDPRVGAWLYNLAHSYALPVIAAAIGYGFNLRVVLGCAIIWFAHIAADRALGYGLKLPISFHDTHLGKIGKTKN